jgi:hypothetical protein
MHILKQKLSRLHGPSDDENFMSASNGLSDKDASFKSLNDPLLEKKPGSTNPEGILVSSPVDEETQTQFSGIGDSQVLQELLQSIQQLSAARTAQAAEPAPAMSLDGKYT